MSDPVDKLTGMLMAAQLEIESLRADLAQNERYEAGLRGEIQQLAERATLAEAKVQDLTAVATGAGNAVERLKAQLAATNGNVAELMERLDRDQERHDL